MQDLIDEHCKKKVAWVLLPPNRPPSCPDAPSFLPHCLYIMRIYLGPLLPCFPPDTWAVVHCCLPGHAHWCCSICNSCKAAGTLQSQNQKWFLIMILWHLEVWGDLRRAPRALPRDWPWRQINRTPLPCQQCAIFSPPPWRDRASQWCPNLRTSDLQFFGGISGLWQR